MGWDFCLIELILGLPFILIVTPKISSLHVLYPLGCDEEVPLSSVPSSYRTLKARGADTWRAQRSPDAQPVGSEPILITLGPCSPTRSGLGHLPPWGTLALNFCWEEEGKKNQNNKLPFRSGIYCSKLCPSGSPILFLPGHMKKQRANYMIAITWKLYVYWFSTSRYYYFWTLHCSAQWQESHCLYSKCFLLSHD